MFGGLLVPAYETTWLSDYALMPAGIGEIGTCLWLLLIGARTVQRLPSSRFTARRTDCCSICSRCGWKAIFRLPGRIHAAIVFIVCVAALAATFLSVSKICQSSCDRLSLFGFLDSQSIRH